MKRYLLFVIAFVCVSIGAWAGPDDPYEIMNTESWNNGAETAAKVKLNQAGNLSAAIAAITAKNCQIIILETAPNVTFTPEDIAALSNLNYATIDLQQYKGDPFTFTNSNVKYVTLPSSWTKEDVKAAGVALSTSANFEAALCQGETNHEPFLTAYVNKPGTLINAIPHLAWTEANGNVKPEYKIGTGVGDCSKLNVLTAMGNICAKDISRRGVYDANGHYVINGIADENLDPAENKGKNTEGGQLYAGADAQGAVDGAIQGCYGIKVIDLRDAIIPDAYCADIVPGYGFVTTDIREIWIPEDPNFKTIPADYLNCSCAVHQICIPGNIETIRTRAFAGSSVNYIWTTGSDPSVRYDNGATFITDPNGENEVRTQRYKTEVGRDITATDKFDPAVEYPLFQNGDDNSFNYGTFTLPASLKLIERFAFYSSTSVSDVYILTPIAPECHVDAFNSSQYHANNTVKVENMKKEVDDDGNEYRIINREAYNNGINQPMAILHYPENTGTPNTQRYTDPTREYSVATGYRDGKGNMMYFPTQTEFEVAEWQATYGYLWNAWNIERTWYNQEVTLGKERAWYGDDYNSTGGFNQAGGQELANQFYLDNPNPNPNNTDPTKTDRSYYDVRLNANGQPTLSQPAGLEWYYDQYRNGNQLYPKAKYEESSYVYVRDDEGNYVKDPSSTCTTIFRAYAGSADDQLERYSREQVPVKDGQGNIIYDGCEEGKYVKDYEWARDDAEGNFVKENVQSGYSATQTLVDGVNTYYSDATGTTAVTPQVGEGMYVKCGTDNDYSKIDPNNEKPGDRAVYYTLSDGVYTPTTSLPLSGNPHLYVSTGNMQTKYVATTKLKFGVTHYYDANGVEVVPGLAYGNPNAGTIYYLDSENQRHDITDMTFVPGEGNYYFEFTYGGSAEVNDNHPSVNLDGTYYYKDGEEPVYEDAQNFTPGTTYYIYNNGYNEQTIEWYMIAGQGQDLYYVSGSHPVYCSAEDEEYDANKTYYSDQDGTVATTITLKGDYYIPTYVDVYREKTNDDVAPFYKKNYLDTYHLATEADAGETERYCMRTEDYQASTPIEYSISHDYRGWHQFVLAGYGYNGVVPNEPIRSFISDNDWWTICEPFDLRYSDMIKFFGYDRQGFDKKIPYLSKLMYVVRDVKNQTITLMFSKNLMEYKEVIDDPTNHVHGTINEETKWDPAELVNDDPIILHKGVPYLIRPNLSVDAQTGNINATRQFNVYKTETGDLYQRLNDSRTLSAKQQMGLIYSGEYTVPAYVVGYDEEGAVSEGTQESKTITNLDGSSFTYTSGTINYHGKDVNYKISSKYTYTFVGSLYKSAMPQYCYFLGWDSNANNGQGGAAFWYSRVLDKSGWNWNNETGIICPNFDTSLKIKNATGINDPARWEFNPQHKENVELYIECDDFVRTTTGNNNAKKYTMDYGASMNLASVDEEPLAEDFGDQEVLSIDEIQSLDVKGEWYNVNGQKLNGRPTLNGVYVVNGKKYVVK